MIIKSFTSVFCFFIGVVLFNSCKHEIPERPPIDDTPPVTTTNCSPDTVYFQQQVLPIFISNCSMSGCHDAASHEEGVILTSYSVIMSTGEIEAGNPNGSKAFEKMIDVDPNDRMPPPPQAPLTTEQIELVRKWILQGAKNNSCESLNCDTTNITFSSSIKPIITNKCLGCHNGASPYGTYDYSQYAGVKLSVDQQRLWGSVNHMPGFSAMPKNGLKLSSCELAKINIWINAGAPNN